MGWDGMGYLDKVAVVQYMRSFLPLEAVEHEINKFPNAMGEPCSLAT